MYKKGSWDVLHDFGKADFPEGKFKSKADIDVIGSESSFVRNSMENNMVIDLESSVPSFVGNSMKNKKNVVFGEIEDLNVEQGLGKMKQPGTKRNEETLGSILSSKPKPMSGQGAKKKLCIFLGLFLTILILTSLTLLTLLISANEHVVVQKGSVTTDVENCTFVVYQNFRMVFVPFLSKPVNPLYKSVFNCSTGSNITDVYNIHFE